MKQNKQNERKKKKSTTHKSTAALIKFKETETNQQTKLLSK